MADPNLNSDTWIEQEYQKRGLEPTPENRRMLQQEYYEKRPYAEADEQARKARTTQQAQQPTPEVAAQGGATTQEQVQGELSTIGGGVLDDSISPYKSTYRPPSRKINYNNDNLAIAATSTSGSIKSQRTPGGVISYYDGDLLVNENNNIERPAYDANGGDLLSEYARIVNPVERNSLLMTMKDYGFYGDKKPSELALSGRGLMSEDERAMQLFFNYSSGQGRTWRAMLPLMQGQAKLVGSGSGRTVSVVSTEDATRIFREESLRLLGRMPTQQEIRAAVGAIQSQQRSRGGGGTMDAPSVTTAAQEQAMRAAPGERAAQSAGQAINQIFALLGGR